MKVKKQKKKPITMIVLREADQPIHYSRFSRMTLYTFLCMLIAAVASIAGWQFAKHQQSIDTIQTLSSQLSKHDSVYNDMISAKESIIQDLRTDIVQLSEQTNSLRVRYEQLEKLKDDVIELLDEVKQSNKTVNLEKNASVAVLSHTPVGMGGVALTPSASEWDSFLDASYLALETLAADTETVSVQLNQTKTNLKQLVYMLHTTPDYWPASSTIVNSEYGIRRDPFTGQASFHSGIDIDGEMSDPVYAAADGTVVETGADHARGKYIIIRHRPHLQTVYMHLHVIHVDHADDVTKGQHIASIGNSGRSTGPHLHFEVIQSDEHVNPLDYLY